MKFQQRLLLIGVVGKKGEGKLDNGQEYKTDRIELHTLGAFDAADPNAVGQTVTVYKIEGRDENYARAVKCIDQYIICDFEMVAAKNLGGQQRVVCRGFKVDGPAPQKAG